MRREWDTAVRAVVGRNLPGRPVEWVRVLGTGRDNTAYEVNGTLVVRFSTEPDPGLRAELVENEGRLLSMIAGVAPVAVPEPRFVDPDAGCLAYDKIPGTPLLALPPDAAAPHAESIAAVLGELLAALHTIPLDRAALLVDPDELPLRAWLGEAATYQGIVGEHIPEAHRDAVRRFLAADPPPPSHEPVFSHNDLGIEHVLVDRATWRVTGVIDWTDAAIVDPAFDFGKLLRDLGPTALAAALRRYGADPAETGRIAQRALFYARCTVFEDLEHGIATCQPAYTEKCRASITWLFPA